MTLSLGGTSPVRARTRRGRMVNAAAPAAVPRNLRRLESLDICLPNSAAAVDAAARSYDIWNTSLGPGGLTGGMAVAQTYARALRGYEGSVSMRKRCEGICTAILLPLLRTTKPVACRVIGR